MRLPRIFRLGQQRTLGEVSTGRDDLDLNQLVPDRVAVAECKERFEVRVAGFVESVQCEQNEGSPKFIAILDDGSGEPLRLVWLGRAEIPGVVAGVPLKARGTIQRKAGRLTMIDPSYTILNRRTP